MNLERALNKASAGSSILRGRIYSRAYGVEAAADVRFGRGCVIRGGTGIRLGRGVTLTDHTWLNVVTPEGKIVIGDNVGLGRRTIISAALRVSVGDDTIFGPNVLVTDHNHEHSELRPVAQQGITVPVPVTVGQGCWIGANTILLPGAVVPDFCVVGANSVVSSKLTATTDKGIPRLIAGSPALVVRWR